MPNAWGKALVHVLAAIDKQALSRHEGRVMYEKIDRGAEILCGA